MQVLTLDFETLYSTEYSLRKMTPVEYILDPRFECTGLAVKWGDAPAEWIEGDQVQAFFDTCPTNVLCISHNALFDMSICAWRYGWVPRVMLDTLGVARAVLAPFLRSLSLDKVGEYLGVGRKTDGLANVRNMGLEQIRANAMLYQRFIEYGKNDVEICHGIYDKLVRTGVFPASEIPTMDAVLRAAVQPKFEVDVELLQNSLGEIQQAKATTLAQAMMLGADGKTALMSNDQFAELLKKHGVEPPTKISGITGRKTFAFAKSDQEFLDLQEHPNFAVQTLVAARLDHKSTIEETRHERFINIGNLNWPATRITPGGNLRLMPMPLKYSGAHTHRLSGDWKMNVQNMGRGSKLRASLKAPKGHTVIAGDESQIEARMVCTLSGQEDMRTDFEQGRDVYSVFASSLFNMEVSKKTPVERWVGKTAILGLGYGLGKDKFSSSLPVLAQNQLGRELDMSPEEGARIVDHYRSKYWRIPAAWKELGTTGIHTLAFGGEWKFGPVTFRKGEIELPNGTKLYYHNLRQVPGGKFGDEWVFDYGFERKRLYGGVLMENICQALARIIVMDAAVRIRAIFLRRGYDISFALQVHDELVYVVPDELVPAVKAVLEHELRRRPEWLPQLPLDCEVGTGPTYGDCK